MSLSSRKVLTFAATSLYSISYRICKSHSESLVFKSVHLSHSPRTRYTCSGRIKPPLPFRSATSSACTVLSSLHYVQSQSCRREQDVSSDGSLGFRLWLPTNLWALQRQGHVLYNEAGKTKVRALISGWLHSARWGWGRGSGCSGSPPGCCVWPPSSCPCPTLGCPWRLGFPPSCPVLGSSSPLLNLCFQLVFRRV